MSDLADSPDPTQPLERIAAIDDPIQRTSAALEQAAYWMERAKFYKRLLDERDAGVLKLVEESVLSDQIIALLLRRVPAPMSDRWNFSREELNAAPVRSLKIGKLKNGGAFVEL